MVGLLSEDHLLEGRGVGEVCGCGGYRHRGGF
jgi:hypothetical protein